MAASDRLWRRELRVGLPGSPHDRLAVLGLAALALFLFRGALSGDKVLFIRDINMVWYPQVEAFVRCIAAGSWPLWDPWRGFGQPLLADPSAQVLYPTTWLNLVLTPTAAYALFVILHLVLSSAGMYVLARTWGSTRIAAFVAGSVWAASGPLLSLTTLWHHYASAAWIPWVVLAADSSMRSGNVRHVLRWSLAATAQILAGSADMAAMTGVAVAWLAASEHVDWRAPMSAANSRVVRTSLLAAVLAAGLSAALWVPTLAVARQSQRWGLPLQDRVTWSLHPAGLAGLLWPVRLDHLPRLSLEHSSERDLLAPWLYSTYLGAGAAVLVAGALAAPVRRKTFLVGLALGTGLMALGRHTPFYEAVTALLPPLRILRFPVKWLLPCGAAWALMAGLGVDQWRHSGPGARRWHRGVALTLALLAGVSIAAAVAVAGPWTAWLRALFRADAPFDWRTQVVAPLTTATLTGAVLFAAGALLHAVSIRGTRAARWAASVAAVLALGELLYAHREPQPLAPRQLFQWRPPVLDHLDRRDHSRLYVYDYSLSAYEGQERGRPWGYPLARVPRGWSDLAGRVLAVHLYLNPPTGERWGVYGSFDLDLLGLHPGALRELNLLLRRVEGTPTHLRLLQMGAVSRVLGLHPDRWRAGLVPVASEDGLFTVPIQVFAVPNPCPRAYVVAGVRVADGPPALAVLQDATFDPTREVILPRGNAMAAPAGPSGAARIEVLAPDYVRIAVDIDRPGYLVLVDAYDPGWTAAVDGTRAEVHRANLAFRAVAVTPGSHRVELRYRPRPVALGLALSLAAALACVALGGWSLIAASNGQNPGPVGPAVLESPGPAPSTEPRDGGGVRMRAPATGRLAREIEHHRSIAPDAEAVWNWDSPAGRRRADRRARLYVEHAPLKPGVRALELGCGTGVFLEKVAPSGASIRGLDLTGELLARARARLSPFANVALDCGNAEQLPYADGAFDAVYGSSVLHHLDLDAALAEAFRVLRPGGRIVFTEPNALNPQVAFMFHFEPTKRYFGVSPDEMAFSRFRARNALEAAGFREIRVEPFDFLHPAIPGPWVAAAEQAFARLERIPLVREAAGSLLVRAVRP